MTIKKIPFSIVFQFFVIIATSALAGRFIMLDKPMWYVSMLLISVFSAIMLYRTFSRTTRDMACFFDAIRNNDTTMQFPSNIKNDSLNELHESLNKLNKHIQQIKLTSEFNEKFYLGLIQQSASGFVVFDPQSNIILINDMACRYAGIPENSANMNLLKIRNPKLFEVLTNLTIGEPVTYQIHQDNILKHLSIRASMIKNEEQTLKLVSLQDIKHELDAKEIESWQKLISILTHEIMNSLAPVTSLAKSLNRYYIDVNTDFDDEKRKKILTDTSQGLKLIEEQSNGLIEFVNNYRKLTKLPKPDFAPFDLQEWLSQIKILLSEKCNEKKIHMEIAADSSITNLYGDKKLLNQVITNVLNNAVDALEEIEAPRKIRIEVTKSGDNRTQIFINNNGSPIPVEILDQIFIPFFTTKETGSGIGLSLSRQIMRLHNGEITVQSGSEMGTTFILTI